MPPVPPMHMRAPLAACLALCLAPPALAQLPPAPTLRALHVTEAPVIDGRLDEEVWGRAAVAEGFIQMVPAAGEPARQRTEVRVLYDARALYVGARMFDPRPDSIADELRRRDDLGGYSDWFHVGIGSYGDGRTGYRFSVNPRGVQGDAFLYDDVHEDDGWDAVWTAAARVDSLGWTAELRIPLSQLRYTPPRGNDAGYSWEINFARDVARLQETSFWAPVPPNAGRLVSLFGTLSGLEALRATRRLEAVPYAVARARRAPGAAGDPFHTPVDPGVLVGGDFRAGLGPVLTLTATFNPDFGQVEADPSEVNLTAFETFLAERRPFFSEGLDVFDFRITPRGAGSEQLFYSRRIGRSPQRGASVPSGGHFRAPESARILGAAKVTGKTATGWTVGALTALTALEEAEVELSGERWREPVEPLTAFGALRLSRDFRSGQSQLGAMGTVVERRLDDERLEFLRRSAYVGGVDTRHRFGQGRYQGTLFLAGSVVEGSPEAILRTQRSSARYFQRPDAEHLTLDPSATRLAGWGGMATLSTLGGRTGWWVAASNRSPGLEVNDAGFQSGADARWAALLLTHNDTRGGRWLRRRGGSFIAVPTWTTAWERTESWFELNLNGDLHNFWSGGFGVTRNLAALSVTELRGGPALHRPARTDGNARLGSDPRRAVSGSVAVSGMREDDTGAWRAGGEVALRLRASPQLNLSLAPSYRKSSITAQWVDGVQRLDGAGRAYLFGRMDQTIAGMTSRVSYTASPRLSVQLYAQPFVAAADFERFRLVAAPRSPLLADRMPLLSAAQLSRDAEAGRYIADLNGNGASEFTFADPDFRVRELRSTAVLRWEYRPGSALFVVWSHGREEHGSDGSFDLLRDARGLLDAEPTHVVLVKATYWFQL